MGAHLYDVFTVRDGLIVRIEEYTTRADALEAAGLKEYAMSQENAELHARAIEAFNRRDPGEFLALSDPEVEFTPYEVWVQGGEPCRGHVGVRTWWEESLAVFPDLRAEVYEIRNLEDRTFVHGCPARARCWKRSGD